MKTKLILLTAIIFIFTAFANAQSSLIGEWEIVSITNGDKGNVALDKADNIITFEKNRFYARVCNNISGTYSINKNQLKTSRVLTTMMACPNIKTERFVTTVLNKITYFSIEKNILTLTDQKKRITLKLEKVEKVKPSFFGSWQLNSFESDKKVYSWMGDVVLNVKKDGIGGNGGCNSYGGNAVIKGNTVKFSNIFSTKMFCEGSIENQYFAALEKVTNFQLKNDQLILTDKTKQTVLIFDKKGE